MKDFKALQGQHGTISWPQQAAWNTSTPSTSTGRMEHFHTHTQQVEWNTSTASTDSLEHFPTLHGQRGTLPHPPLAAWNIFISPTVMLEHLIFHYWWYETFPQHFNISM